jgi:hypothetical protein
VLKEVAYVLAIALQRVRLACRQTVSFSKLYSYLFVSVIKHIQEKKLLIL